VPEDDACGEFHVEETQSPTLYEVNDVTFFEGEVCVKWDDEVKFDEEGEESREDEQECCVGPSYARDQRSGCGDLTHDIFGGFCVDC